MQSASMEKQVRSGCCTTLYCAIGGWLAGVVDGNGKDLYFGGIVCRFPKV
jgi:hypothetical protein